MLIELLVLLVVVVLLWWAISYIPVPADAPPIKPILYVVLLVGAAVYLWSKYGG